MKISALGTTVLLLACVTCNYGQMDMEKGFGMIKKAMSCFGNVDLTKMMQTKGDGMNPGKLMKAFQSCKSQPMDQMDRPYKVQKRITHHPNHRGRHRSC
ncbi:uncharacterized protein [Dermacentor andersoni]|uniref:uncharacterized protein isoform X3 n=1 Tax=Dermacentor andersoni TaxID=34620 RepID=UPI003B3A474B